MAASRLRTRAGSTANADNNDLSSGLQSTIQSEMTKYLTSESFQSAIKSSIHSVLVDMVKTAIEPLERKLNDLEKKVEWLEAKANDNEQYSRRSNVRIYGLGKPVEDGDEDAGEENDIREDCADTVIRFFDNDLGVPIQRSEIDRAHRVGKPNDAGQRALIVKFSSYEAKMKIMRSKKLLKGKGVYINEDLTWVNQQLYKRAREMCKDHGYVFTADGYILVKWDEDGVTKIERIRRDSDLQKLGFTH